MRIAVLVVSHQSAAWLPRLLDALERQVRQPDRILVVDTASADGAPARLAARAGVEWRRCDSNVGFARANNLGVAALDDCEWIALLNPDAFPEPGWLAALEAAVRAHPGTAMFASQQRLDADPSRLDGAGDAYHLSGLAWRIGHGGPIARGAAAREVFGPCAAAAFVARDAYLSAGGFDEAYFAYMEDVDLAFRLRLLGHRCRYVPDAVVRHVGGGSGAGRAFAVYHGHRNLVWTFVKNMPGQWLWRALPQHLLLTIASLVRLTLQGHGAAILRAKRDAVRGLPRALAQRKAIQAARRVAPADVVAAMARGWLAPYREHRRRDAAD